MKKLLTILGSLGVAATAAAGVVACGTSDNNNDKAVSIDSVELDEAGTSITLKLNKALTADQIATVTVKGFANKDAAAKLTVDMSGIDKVQAEGEAPADTTPKLADATVQSAKAAKDGKSIVLTLDKSVKGATVEASNFALDVVTPSNKEVSVTKAELKDSTLTITLDKELQKSVTVKDIKVANTALTDSTATGLDKGSKSIVVTLSANDAKVAKKDAAISINGLKATSIKITSEGTAPVTPTDNSDVSVSKAELKDSTLTITLDKALEKAIVITDIKLGDKALTDSTATGLDKGTSIVVTLSDTDKANATEGAAVSINGLKASDVKITLAA